MRLASLKRGGRDGTLVAVNQEGTRVATVAGYGTLQAALDDWSDAQHALNSAVIAAEQGETVSPSDFAAPLPRAWQWLDGSAFVNHGALMQFAMGHDPIENDQPFMYQGMSPSSSVRPTMCPYQMRQTVSILKVSLQLSLAMCRWAAQQTKRSAIFGWYCCSTTGHYALVQ